MKITDGFDGMLFGLDLAKEDKIICLVGASGSGKTTLAKELEKLGYNIIHSYTTREPREEGEWGHTFIDCLSDDFTVLDCIDNRIIPNENIIAFFNDYKKDEAYWATRQQYQGKGTSIYIVDPEGAEQVKENVKDAEVVTIFLMADKDMRRDRLLKRYDPEAYYQGTTWLPNEIIERIDKDKEIFETCKCDYVVDANREVEEVLKDVVEIIC